MCPGLQESGGLGRCHPDVTVCWGVARLGEKVIVLTSGPLGPVAVGSSLAKLRGVGWATDCGTFLQLCSLASGARPVVQFVCRLDCHRFPVGS